MIVRFTGDTDFLVLTNGKRYSVLAVEKGWFRIVDDSGSDYLYPPECFEIVDKSIAPSSDEAEQSDAPGRI